MNTSSKTRNTLIAIILSIVLMLGAFLTVIFLPKTPTVSADEYNYGEFNEAGYYSLNGVTFYGIKIKKVSSTTSGEEDEATTNYWPSYEIVKENEKPVVIKFGETVLLKDDEAILICFARQTDDGKETGLVLDETGGKISKPVDYLNATVKVNGKEGGPANENNLPGESDEAYIKELGYIIDPNKIISESGKLGVNEGNEGLVEFSTKEYEIEGTLQNFSFMFYVFKESTYKRTETTNTAENFVRPNSSIFATNQVSDPSTIEDYFTEYFFYFEDQDLPYLTFDPTRYEISIEKTVHRTSTTYTFAYDKTATSGKETVINQKITKVAKDVGETRILQTISQALSTMDIYARTLRVEQDTDEDGNATGKIRIYFEDLGEYKITYTAVYHNDSGERIVLDNLNEDSRADKLTVFGTELTYQDGTNGQTPLRNEDNTFYADLTGILTVGGTGENAFSFDEETGTWKLLNLSSDLRIASTNQPPIKLMFNSIVNEFDVYFSTSIDGEFEKQDGYSYTSNFDKPGYYVLVVNSNYNSHKTWVSATKTARIQTMEVEQVYVFQIKQQTSNLQLYVLGDDGNIVSESERERIYYDNYVKNGVQIIEFEKANEFDSQIYFEITKKGYSQTAVESQTFTLPNESASELSEETKAWLLSFGIEKFDGYYVLKPREGVNVDGIYSLSLKFGKSGKETITFKLDTEEIGGILSYSAVETTGTQYFSTRNLIGGEGQIGLTNMPFTLLWSNKTSGSKITAKFVRFTLDSKTYSANDSDYILNSSWLASDFAITLSSSNPETIYEKAESKDKVTAKSVLSLSGLYIFQLQDEAGNVAYYSIIVDDSISTVLQKPTSSSDSFKKITGVNNVSEATTIFFGSHKAIQIIQYVSGSANSVKEDSSIFGTEGTRTTAQVYLSALFKNLEKYDRNGIISTSDEKLFVAIPIKSVYSKTGNTTTLLSQEVIDQGYYNIEAPLNEDNRLQDLTYYFQIYDESNLSKNSPTTSYVVRFNTDATGLLIYTESGKVDQSTIDSVNSKTADDYSERVKYFKATDGLKIYLTWDNLMPIDELGAFVDVKNGGLVCQFYPLVYNKVTHTYEYGEESTEIGLGLETLSDEQLKEGYNAAAPVEIPLNVIGGQTQAGKYVITRTYSPSSGSTLGDLGSDFERIQIVFFVDRNEIISPENIDGERVGFYTYITTFDGGDYSNKEFFNELYRQSQNSSNYVIQTNQLPIGFYIPVSKYGTVNRVDNGILGNVLGLEEVQQTNISNLKFVDSVKFNGLDVNQQLGLTSTYSPFELSVVLVSPEVQIKDGNEENVYYYYSLNKNGYYMLSGYSIGELGPSESPTPIANAQAFLNGSTVGAQYATGNYELRIGCIINNKTNTYEQNFKVIVNVYADGPEYEMDAEYSDLENMESKDIISENGTDFWTNSNEIRISWSKTSNEFLTAIDIAQISYTYAIGTSRVTVPSISDFEGIVVVNGEEKTFYFNGEQINPLFDEDEQRYYIEIDSEKSYLSFPIVITQSGNTFNFVASFPADTTNLTIEMGFEGYSADVLKYYRPYYPNSLYKETKNVYFDRVAPVESITVLRNGDKTIEGVVEGLLRESSDSRYSKSSTEGMFAYYTYKVDKSYFFNLASSLSSNPLTSTKTFYYRSFDEKYSSSAFKETGLGYDKTSRGDNLFSEYFAEGNGWIKVSDKLSEETIISNGYYEIVELDFSGNATIYSVYVGESRNIEINVDRKIKDVENGTISISKSTDENLLELINAEVKFGESSQIFEKISNEPAIVSSYDFLTLNSIAFGDSNPYSYLKFIVDQVVYFLTPSNLENDGDNLIYTSAFNSLGEKVNLKDIQISGEGTSHTISFVDTVNTISKEASIYSVEAKVSSSSSRLTDNGGALIVSDPSGIVDAQGNPISSTLALMITTPINPALFANEESIRIFKISSDGGITQYKVGDSENPIYIFENVLATSKITYYYVKAENDFLTSTFYVLYKDNFDNEYKDLVEYKAASFNRFEGDMDITPDSQYQNEILVSGPVAVNISNIYHVTLTNEKGGSVVGKFNKIDSLLLGGAYTQYQLFAPTSSSSSFTGGKITFKIDLKYNIPDEILDAIAGMYETDANGVIETIYVTIFNQLPVIKATDLNGEDISDALFGKEINQSDSITLSFLNGNEISDALGYTTKVFLRKRGTNTNYVQISSPYVVSEAGIYDIYMQNFDADGNPLSYTVTKDFVISDLDVMFYTVVKTNSDGDQEIVAPTGKVFEYEKGKFASYHYIVNANQFDVITNGAHVSKNLIYSSSNVYVYEIASNAGTIYKATIAVSVVDQTNDILALNPFIWHLGTTYSVPSENNYIRSTTKEIYLCADDIYDQITLRWASYFGIVENEITCYVSRDEGKTWFKAEANSENGASTLVLSKSSSYLFKFEDLAGNIQLFSSPSGFPSETTKVNFIRSVIINVNGGSAIDNAVYNESVTITIPVSTTRFYSTTPTISVLRNNEVYEVSSTSKGEYVFNETGTYRIVFSAKVEGGTKDLNEDVLTFTIINKNDSRWAFNYVNYNNYEISSIKFNGEELADVFKQRILEIDNEINLSAFDVDSIGNRWFDNGVYTITLLASDSTGTQTIEFSFWLNSSTVPMSVSLKEGESTTGSISIEYNKGNLFEILGDCYIQIDSKVIDVVDSESGFESVLYTLNNVGEHYIQVYTSSGKLVYSYNVEITEPLNTISIILIVVSCVVVVAGLLIFFLLRKRMQVR